MPGRGFLGIVWLGNNMLEVTKNVLKGLFNIPTKIFLCVIIIVYPSYVYCMFIIIYPGCVYCCLHGSDPEES